MALNDTEIDLLLDNSEDEDDPPGPLCDSDLESDYSPDDSEDSDASTDSNSDDENETASQITNAANGRDGPPPNNAPAPAQNVARGRGRGRGGTRGRGAIRGRGGRQNPQPNVPRNPRVSSSGIEWKSDPPVNAQTPARNIIRFRSGPARHVKTTNEVSFLRGLVEQLITPQMITRNESTLLRKETRLALELSGIKRRLPDQLSDDEEPQPKKRKRCSLCPYGKHRKSKVCCYKCKSTVCGEHSSIICETCQSNE